jgi:hypothetical protein
MSPQSVHCLGTTEQKKAAKHFCQAADTLQKVGQEPLSSEYLNIVRMLARFKFRRSGSQKIARFENHDSRIAVRKPALPGVWHYGCASHHDNFQLAFGS